MRTITVLIPAYNEEANIDELYRQLTLLADNSLATGSGLPDMRVYDWEFLFVNDGSQDRTLAKLVQLRQADPRVNIVNLSRNFGKENALLAGFDYAGGDAVVVIDADLQHPLETIPEMVHWWQQGYDDVYGQRITRGREPWLRRKLSLAYYSLLQKSTKVEVLPNVGDFRLLSRRAVEALRKIRETQRYTKGMYCYIGYPKKAVPFEQHDRHGGRSSFRPGALFNLAVEGITSFTTAPLRFSAIAGAVVSALSFLYVLWILIKTIIWGDPVAGFPTLVCCILFLGGIQLISIGIIGEYIGRIFTETKHRPVYIVDTYNNEKVSVKPGEL